MRTFVLVLMLLGFDYDLGKISQKLEKIAAAMNAPCRQQTNIGENSSEQ